MNSKKAAKIWGISERRVRLLCRNGKVEGARLIGKTWAIQDEAKKPMDGRTMENRLLKEIESLKSKLFSLRPLTEGELKRLSDEFVTDYTYDSNAIEGSTLTLRETALVLRGITIGKKPLRDHLSAIGHKEAFDYISELVSNKEPLSERVIKEVHSLVLADRREDRGVYRKIPVTIIGAKEKTCDPLLIPNEMKKLLDWYLNDENDDFLVKLAKFHILFEGIHPFIDGNGRTGRLIVNMELMKMGYPPINIKYTDRMAYYRAFESYYSKDHPKAMAKLFGKYLLERLRSYVSLLS